MAKAAQIAASGIEAFNAHDEQRIRSLYEENVVFAAPGGIRLEGVDSVVEYVMAWLGAFPDARLEVELEIVDGDWAAQRFVFEGTHEELLNLPSGELPATHRRLRVHGVEFMRVEGGRICEEYLCYDQAEVLTQLGLIPELASRA